MSAQDCDVVVLRWEFIKILMLTQRRWAATIASAKSWSTTE